LGCDLAAAALTDYSEGRPEERVGKGGGRAFAGVVEQPEFGPAEGTGQPAGLWVAQPV
jgi:hypothetical protein